MEDVSDEKIGKYPLFYEFEGGSVYVEDSLEGQTNLNPETWETDRYSVYEERDFMPGGRLIDTFDDLEEAREYLEDG